MLFERTKNIDVKLQFVRDVVESGKVLVKKGRTEYNPVDRYMKVITTSKFNQYLDLINVTILPKP